MDSEIDKIIRCLMENIVVGGKGKKVCQTWDVSNITKTEKINKISLERMWVFEKCVEGRGGLGRLGCI